MSAGDRNGVQQLGAELIGDLAQVRIGQFPKVLGGRRGVEKRCMVNSGFPPGE